MAKTMMLHDETYALIRLLFDRAPGQPIDLQTVKAIGPVAMRDWTTLRVEMVRMAETAVSPPQRYVDLFW